MVVSVICQFLTAGKFGILKTPLQRIVTGCFLCGMAFVASGILELELQKGYPELPKDSQVRAPCSVSSFKIFLPRQNSTFTTVLTARYLLRSQFKI